jgi:DNA-binding NarL/FixJ family response regulator
MQTNNFQELIKEYEAHCQNTSTQEYTDILYELSFSIACAVLKITVLKTGNPQLADLKSELCKDYSTLRLINSGTVTDSRDLEYLIRNPLGDGMDLVHTASATLINQTKQYGNIVGFMESPYKERRLKKKVWIKKADSINGWETVETTPIQEVYKSVRREIENSRAMSTDPRNGYTYLEEISQDSETGATTKVYKRLTKYADLGGCAMASPYDSVENTVLSHSTGRKNGLYSVDNSTAKDIEQMIDCLSLTQKQSVVLQLRLSGYGYKAISTYLGVTNGAVISTLKCIQKKALSELQLPDYLIEQLQTVNHNNKLTINDKATIKQMFNDGYTMAYIAEQFNVSKMTISRVINGRKDRQVGR